MSMAMTHLVDIIFRHGYIRSSCTTVHGQGDGRGPEEGQ